MSKHMPLFKKQTVWHKLNHIDSDIIQSMLEKIMIKIQMNSKTLCITKYKNTYYAFDDKCPHQAASLSKGYCNENGEVVCEWHKYAYDLKNGRCKSQGGGFMNTYLIEKREDGFYIGFEKIRLGLWD